MGQLAPETSIQNFFDFYEKITLKVWNEQGGNLKPNWQILTPDKTLFYISADFTGLQQKEQIIWLVKQFCIMNQAIAMACGMEAWTKVMGKDEKKPHTLSNDPEAQSVLMFSFETIGKGNKIKHYEILAPGILGNVTEFETDSAIGRMTKIVKGNHN